LIRVDLSICCSFVVAVQKERDRLGRQRHPNYAYRFAPVKSADFDDDDEDDLSITALLRAEQTAREVNYSKRKPVCLFVS